MSMPARSFSANLVKGSRRIAELVPTCQITMWACSGFTSVFMRSTISAASWPPTPLFQTWILMPGIAASSFILSWAG